MHPVIRFLAVSALFVAINAFAAGFLLVFFKAAQTLSPALMENPLVTYTVGIAGLALVIGSICWAIKLINRPSFLQRSR